MLYLLKEPYIDTYTVSQD